MNTPLLPEALYAGGVWMLERERPLDAAHFFRAMLLDQPEDERAWLGLGTCHEQLGQDDQALELYLCGFVAASRRVRCGVAMARVLRRRGEEARAEQALEEVEVLAAAEELETLVAHERSAA